MAISYSVQMIMSNGPKSWVLFIYLFSFGEEGAIEGFHSLESSRSFCPWEVTLGKSLSTWSTLPSSCSFLLLPADTLLLLLFPFPSCTHLPAAICLLSRQLSPQVLSAPGAWADAPGWLQSCRDLSHWFSKLRAKKPSLEAWWEASPRFLT